VAPPAPCMSMAIDRLLFGHLLHPEPKLVSPNVQQKSAPIDLSVWCMVSLHLVMFLLKSAI